MFAKYTINTGLITTGITATTINIPLDLSYSFAGQDELIEAQFVDIEIQDNINPILDYEKARYLPANMDGGLITSLTYNLYFQSGGTYFNPTFYGNIGFNNDDLKFEKNSFTESFVQFNFFDSDNPLTQNLITQLQIFSMLTQDDLYAQNNFINGVYIIAGQAKPALAVPVRFVLSNPLLVKKAFYEGYHLYDYKDDVSIGVPKFLYMRSTYYNSKTGDVKNLMTVPTPQSIDTLASKLHIKFKLYRDQNSFYYAMDDTYSNNISFTTSQGSNFAAVNLFEIQTI